MYKILFICSLIPLCANAFINIESLRENTTDGLNSSLKFLFNQQTGNTDKTIASASSFNSYEELKDEYIAIAGIQYGESFKQKDTENGSVHLRYTRQLNKKHYAELYTQYEYNKFKALNSRKLIGFGHRYTTQYINIGVGAFNEHEEISNRPDQNAIRGNFYISSSVKSETGVEFSSIIYIQPSFERGNDLRSILITGLSQKMSNNINLLIEYQNVHDEQPPKTLSQMTAT